MPLREGTPEYYEAIRRIKVHYSREHFCTTRSIEDLLNGTYYDGPPLSSSDDEISLEEQITEQQIKEKPEESKKSSKATAKRRNRRNKLKSLLKANKSNDLLDNNHINEPSTSKKEESNPVTGHEKDCHIKEKEKYKKMSDDQTRADVLAARQAKKLAKGKVTSEKPAEAVAPKPTDTKEQTTKEVNKGSPPKSKDEVDKAIINTVSLNLEDVRSKEQIKAERAAKKAAKQAKKKGAGEESTNIEKPVVKHEQSVSKPVNEDMTVKDVVETLRDIAAVAKDMKNVTDKVSAINLGGKQPESQKADNDKPDASSKSKAELKAERRAKQEAQRAAKQVTLEQKVADKPKVEAKVTPAKEERPPKQKSVEKTKPKSQSGNRVNWFQHLNKEHDKESLKSIAINSHLHPAIVKLGVQLSSRVVTGSNARCVALLDALKKMVRDYTLPAKTEFSRGLDSHLASSLEYLWAMRPPSATQSNAVKFFRYHLTQLPNNVDEFDAKKTLQEEIDRYIREQIDMAGEAISIAVRNKISDKDNILTYGCSSLIERILRDAWSAGLKFRTVVVGNRVHANATQMFRRLVAHGVPCTYADITSLSCVMLTVSKVVLGAGALLADGAVLGALGTAQVALAARARNVPVLVAVETHKVCERVHTDAFVYNEIGDPDDLIDKSDDNSPLKDWRSNPNLTPLNLTYDVTPASLVTAVVTELAILPCTSAPVVLRFKISEYSV